MGIVVGCTELPMIFDELDLPVAAFDTTRLHAEAAVRFCAGGRSGGIPIRKNRMHSGILDIDHLMVCVGDSQAAGETFERLGFTVTPKSGLPGLSNRLICFETRNPAYNNFIELMAWEDRAAAPALMNDILTDLEQPVSMVMCSADARSTGEALDRRGFDPYPAMDLERDWILPDGRVVTPKFVVSIPKAGRSPLYWNVCEYKNPEVYRQREFLGHANGARRFAGVLAVADDPEAVAGHFRDVWDAGTEPAGGAVTAVSPGLVPLFLLTPDAAEACYGVSVRPERDAAYLGFVIEVENIAGLCSRLSGSGIEFREAGAGSICLGPENLHGCLVEFREA